MDDRLGLTFVPGALAPSAGGFAAWSSDPSGDDALVAALAARGLPRGEVTRLARAATDTVAAPTDVRVLPLLPVVRWLAELPLGDDEPAWRRPAASVRAWSVAAKLALEFVAAGRLVPGISADAPAGEARAWWRVATGGDVRPALLVRAMPSEATDVLRGDGTPWPREAVVHAFLDAVADACGRRGRQPVIDPRARGPRDTWERMWSAALIGADPTVAHLRAPAAEIAADVDEWSAPLLGRERDTAVRLVLRLEPPGGEGSEDDPDTSAPAVITTGTWELALGLNARDSGATLGAEGVWAGEALEADGRPVRDPVAALARALAGAARLFPPLERALDQARPTRIVLEPTEVAALLDDGIVALEAADVVVVVPPSLADAERGRLRLRIRIGGGVEPPRVDGVEALSLRALGDARYEVALGDDALGLDDIAALLATPAPLVRWRGRWVRVDADEARRLADWAGRTVALDLTESLIAALAQQHQVPDHGWVDVVADGAVAALITRLRDASAPEDARTEGLVGELRPYQRRGVAWLQRMGELGLGAVLADQMGLGKTVQAIALLASRAQDRPHLVVAPTSVVGNWERELNRFAPGLPVVRHHGRERAAGAAAFVPGSVAVTSYALLRRDAGLLAAVPWDVVVLDEAQQIKNPSSVGARAARELDARMRVAMTGTPVENRLSELWAVIDVTNPGLLGPRRRFEQGYAIPIERWQDAEAAARLSPMIAPFALRRRKGDDDVALDLPPKSAVQVDVPLTREQADLYDAAVDAAFAGAGLGRTAFERRGRILALITALKQICNHPAHYLRDGGALRGRSGKLDRVTDLLGEVIAGEERALVFTQYTEMGQLLVTHLEAELGLTGVPFLHGGTPLAERDRMVARFQEDDEASPLLIVSLRAGGTGLNLTRATQVVHFDRWWNPAVEDQATDRAHRIGQTRSVTVHTLVTTGTVEERISALLERKRGLADAVVDRTEGWITELSDDDLHALVALSGDEVAELEGGDDDALDESGPAHPPAAPRPALRLIDGGRS